MKVFLSYALGIAGVVTLLVVIGRTFGGLRYLQARLMIVNLLRTNPNQAELVCRATPGTFLEAINAAIKIAAMMKSQDPKIVASATQPAYDAATQGIAAKLKPLVGKVKLAGMMVGGALALGISAGTPPIPVILLAVVFAAGAIWLFVWKADVERSMVLARAEVLPEVDRAFVEGRYRLP